MATRDVTIRINAKDHASKVFRRVAIAAGAFLSLRQFARAAKQSLSLFAEQEKATQKLSQAIKATGGALGFTTQDMRDYAAELQNTSTISNEFYETAISIMATFRNVQGETFKRSIRLAADMSVALGTDLKSSVIMLGKALNDPVIGMSALNRVGITFSETQKKLIKQLVEQNDLLGAQKVQLDELSNQFGGQAKKAMEGYSGSIDQMKNAWDDAKKAVGEFLATASFIDMQDNIRLSTILIENYGLTAELAGKRYLSLISEAQDALTFHKFFKGKLGYQLSPETINILDRMEEIQETLAAPLAERLSAMIPTPDWKGENRWDLMFEEAFGKRFDEARSWAKATSRGAAEKAFAMPSMALFPERSLGAQRQQFDKGQRITERREELAELRKEGTRSEKSIELQEEMLRALEKSPMIRVSNFD